MSFFDDILGLLAPHECLGCGSEGSLLCLGCSRQLAPARPFSLQSSGLSKVQSVTLYDNLAKKLVWELKFNGAQAASVAMAHRMFPMLSQNAVLVPVPTATRRVRQRGYDQAKLLARALARHSGLIYWDCLRRTGQTHQLGSSRLERFEQIKAAFSVKREVSGKRIILVDDVITTGATLVAAATVLSQAGAIRVEAVTFAQA